MNVDSQEEHIKQTALRLVAITDIIKDTVDISFTSAVSKLKEARKIVLEELKKMVY